MQSLVDELIGRWSHNALVSMVILIVALMVNVVSAIAFLFCVTTITSDDPQRFAWYVVSGLLVSPFVFWMSTVVYQNDVLSQRNSKLI